MKRALRFVLAGLMLLLLIVAVWQRELLDYGVMQGRGQFNVLWNARPVEEVMQDPATPDSLRQKLRFVQEVRDFAVNSLGIRNTDNYNTLFDQQGKDILWVVTACRPYSLEQKYWTFPIVGKVSYKGYFDYERALQEEAVLAGEGYDTYVRSVGAWSTLGWFKDPILSNMLFRGDGELSNTVIHELTHGTIFVKDSLDFNENLATFIGHVGALRYMSWKWGEDSPALQAYKNRYEGRHLFSEHMLRGLRELEQLYEGFPETMPETEKEKAKQALFGEIVARTDTLPVENAGRWGRFLEKMGPNNAYLMSFERYRGEQNALARQLESQFNGNLKAFLAYYKKEHGVE
jgi:predicted aminopeptidase